MKDAVYERFARIGKALASAKRLELLDLLGQGPRTVEALAEQTGASVANASQHLQVLRTAGLVATERRGQFIEYRLTDDEVARCIAMLRQLAESRFSEMRNAAASFLGEDDGEPIDAKELLRRSAKGDAVILDVRPVAEYAAGHLPGAISVPLPEVSKRLRELSKRKEIVAYCRGPYCMMAAQAVALLRKRGFKARRLDEGIADWRLQGLRIEKGEP